MEEVNRLYRPRPRLGELEFEALYIDAANDFRGFVLPLLITVLLLVVPVARAAFGDWTTAWTVGGYFVALATLYSMLQDDTVL